MNSTITCNVVAKEFLYQFGKALTARDVIWSESPPPAFSAYGTKLHSRSIDIACDPAKSINDFSEALVQPVVNKWADEMKDSGATAVTCEPLEMPAGVYGGAQCVYGNLVLRVVPVCNANTDETVMRVNCQYRTAV
jgi:hypothetical protein